MRSDKIITILDRDLIRTDMRRCVLVRVSKTDTCCDRLRLLARLCHDETTIGIYTSKTNIYLITFLISEDKITLMMEGAENATFALLMYAYDKT